MGSGKGGSCIFRVWCNIWFLQSETDAWFMNCQPDQSMLFKFYSFVSIQDFLKVGSNLWVPKAWQARRVWGLSPPQEISKPGMSETPFPGLSGWIWGKKGGSSKPIEAPLDPPQIDCPFCENMKLENRWTWLGWLCNQQNIAWCSKVNLYYIFIPDQSDVGNKVEMKLLWLVILPQLECGRLIVWNFQQFPIQEGTTRNFPRKEVFAWPKKEGVQKKKKKKKPWSAAHGGRRKKISQEKQKRQILSKRL